MQEAFRSLHSLIRLDVVSFVPSHVEEWCCCMEECRKGGRLPESKVPRQQALERK